MFIITIQFPIKNNLKYNKRKQILQFLYFFDCRTWQLCQNRVKTINCEND
jgi:hypothetical protein